MNDNKLLGGIITAVLLSLAAIILCPEGGINAANSEMELMNLTSVLSSFIHDAVSPWEKKCLADGFNGPACSTHRSLLTKAVELYQFIDADVSKANQFLEQKNECYLLANVAFVGLGTLIVAAIMFLCIAWHLVNV